MMRGRLGSALIRPNSKIRLLLPLSAFHFPFFLPRFAAAAETRGRVSFFSSSPPSPLPSPKHAARHPSASLSRGPVDDAKKPSWRCRQARAPRSHAGTNLPVRPCACRPKGILPPRPPREGGRNSCWAVWRTTSRREPLSETKICFFPRAAGGRASGGREVWGSDGGGAPFFFLLFPHTAKPPRMKFPL